MAKRTTKRVVPAKRGVRKSHIFKFDAPGAVSVMLVGDFTGWQQDPISLRPGAEGLWQAEVALAPGIHHYRFLVDGVWSDDPACAKHEPNAFGSQDCVIEVG